MNKQEILDKYIYPAMADNNIQHDGPADLLGKDSTVDSLGLVKLVITIEAIMAADGKLVTLVSDNAMSRSKSPFKNTDALARYILELI
jgi:hypothetical protein